MDIVHYRRPHGGKCLKCGRSEFPEGPDGEGLNHLITENLRVWLVINNILDHRFNCQDGTVNMILVHGQ